MSETRAPQEFIIAGRYRVLRELGRGGMGSVYEAENLRTRRRVALKTMRPDVSERAGFAQRFEREAQAGGQLRHPNIIDILDMGDDEAYGLVFIVQEFLNGGDLAKCLKTVGALAPHAVLATLLPVMEALDVAHGQGIVHRDIKPDNIFLHETPQGVIPKLIDFGIAKFTHELTEEELSCTATGQMIGSPNYMSPEQARGDGDLDPRSDVWSLGVVFYKCLSRSIPYSAPTASSLLAKIIYEEPVSLGLLAPHLPADLVAVIQRAVVKDRAQRWPSMRAFADALRACALWQGVDAARAQGWVVNARGETVLPLPPTVAIVPSGPAPLPPNLALELSSGLRSGPWGGEVPAQRPPASSAGRSSMILAAVLGILGLGIASTAAFLWPRRPLARTSGLPLAAAVPAARPALRPAATPLRPPPLVAAGPPPAPVVAVPVVAAPVVAAPLVAAPLRPAPVVAAPVVAAPTPVADPVPAGPTVHVRSAPRSAHAHPAAAPAGATRRGHNGALIMR